MQLKEENIKESWKDSANKNIFAASSCPSTKLENEMTIKPFNVGFSKFVRNKSKGSRMNDELNGSTKVKGIAVLFQEFTDKYNIIEMKNVMQNIC